MRDVDVLIVGAGPTGLMLAGELALAGVDAAILERRPDQEIAGVRAGGLHARTLEVLDQRGLVERFLAEGQKAQVTGFAAVHFDISAFPTRHNYTLGLWQAHIERILAGWAGELRVPIHRGCEVAGFSQDEAGIEVRLADGRALRARYLVGCDGGRSLVRKTAGIDFPGSDPTTSSLLAVVEMSEEPPLGVRQDATGTHGLGRMEYEIRDGEIIYKNEGPVRVMITEAGAGATGEPTFEDIRAGLVRVYGTDFGAHSPSSISRFTDMSRQAAAYRQGRVLLAGDAAHVHAPDGGQGLNTGVQDAVNLGWKLAQAVKGVAPDSLLDTYHAERHPVGARILRNTMAAAMLRRPDERTRAVREVVGELLAMEEPRRHMAGMMTGLDIRYDFGEGHPLLGRRTPDLEVETDAGPVRVFNLLHAGRPVLINFGAPGTVDAGAWRERVRSVEARYDGAWELPVVGVVEAPAAVLVRPDGHVAWVGRGDVEGLAEAMTRWFGAPGR